MDELLLQTDGMRGQHDPAVFVGRGRQDRRDQISKAFADARAGFDHEMARRPAMASPTASAICEKHCGRDSYWPRQRAISPRTRIDAIDMRRYPLG